MGSGSLCQRFDPNDFICLELDIRLGSSAKTSVVL